VLAVAACWCVVEVQPQPILGRLAILKGAAAVGFALGRRQGQRRTHYQQYHYPGHYHHHYRYGRSIEPEAGEAEDLLLATATRLDTDGCIKKLLCLLQTKNPETLTPEEDLLQGMFTNATDITASGANFVYASDIGAKTHDAATCKKFFSKCSYGQEELTGLLQQSWGCSENLFPEDPATTSGPLEEAPVGTN